MQLELIWTKILQKNRNKESEKENEGGRGWLKEKGRHEREKECERDGEKAENLKELEQQHYNQSCREMVIDQEDLVTVKHAENKAFGGNHLLFSVACLSFHAG